MTADRAPLVSLIRDAGSSRVPPDVLEARGRGLMVGLAAGNALGVEVEFVDARRMAERFPGGLREIPERNRTAPWDDDLAQAAIIAECIAKEGALDAAWLRDALVRWARENGRGIGGLTAAVIDEMAAGTPALEAARIVWERSGRDAAGNGAVMRCAPVALRFRLEPERLIDQAILSAHVTHHDPRCVWSTVATVVAAAAALGGASLDPAALAAALDRAGAPDTCVRAVEEAGAIGAVAEIGLDGPDQGYTLKAMQVGLWALRAPGSFEDALVEVVMAGGDTDTNGAVAGAILGARHGVGAVPARWAGRIRDADVLRALADDLSAP